MQNLRLETVPKYNFSYLLIQALDKMYQVTAKPNFSSSNISSGIKRYLMSAFCATDIDSFNKNEILDWLPKEDEVSEQEIESTLTTLLKDSRYGYGSNQLTRKKAQLDVAPGKSIATSDGNVLTPSLNIGQAVKTIMIQHR